MKKYVLTQFLRKGVCSLHESFQADIIQATTEYKLNESFA